jgi:ubiquinol-cytochrome c reductase cytochrome b subunit
VNALWQWVESRTGITAVMKEALYEPIPGGARWRYVWGSTLTFVFGLQVLTGLLLWSAYSPSTLTAWESVYYIQYQMSYGWLIRGIHHFAAQAMMILLVLHFMQVVIDGAYRAPREVNFWLGLVLMQIVMGLSLTGYLLPWDQKGYYATQVATKIAGVTPVVGPYVQQLVQGGPSYGHHTLTRFFALHAGLLPIALVGFLALHIAVFRKHGIHAPAPDRAPTGWFWPDQILKDAVACLAVLAAIIGLSVYEGAELAGPADPAEAYSAARPEWYFLFLFQFLKFELVEELGLAFGAIYLPGLVMGVIALMPLVGKWNLGHRFNVAFVFALMLGVVYLTGLAMLNDARNADHQLAVKSAEKDGHRAVELANEFGIPPLGALTLLREDPLTQGPKLFAKNCSSCHRYEGHNGLGVPVTVVADGKLVDAPMTAPELSEFGTREWMKNVLVDYAGVIAPLGNMVDQAAGQRFLQGDMANWSKENKAALTDPANAESLAALVEFVVAQSERADLAPFDAAKVELGQKIFVEGKLAQGELTSACADCHSMKLAGASAPLAAGSGDMVPTLTGYGGTGWLNRLIGNPAHPEFYGEHNAMPVFEKQLTPEQINLISRWLVGDYFKSQAH